MQIKGLAKTSLIDYPGHITATVFTGGCNMLCPFCHNRKLVFNEDGEDISLNSFFEFLHKRKNTLEAVCITGGEPTLQKDLIDFLFRLREFDLKIKLDTNGLMPNILYNVINNNLVDYVAMDIKNCKEKYPETAGISKDRVVDIDKSTNILMNSNINYEFRTTVVKEFHNLDDLISISKWIKGAKYYFLQQYKKSDQQLSPQPFTPYSKEEMNNFLIEIKSFFSNISLREV